MCNCKPYAFVYIYCIKDIRFPYYLKVQHQQGIADHTYRIACMSYADVDYYQQLCQAVPESLSIVAVHTSDTDEYRQAISGGSFEEILDIRNWIDGKIIEGGLPLRNVYEAEPFTAG